jgi:hypothetical protein
MAYEGSRISVARLPLGTASAAGALRVGSNISISSGIISLGTTNITDALGYTPLSLAGGVLTGALTLSGAPTSDLHAATKAYVDATAQGLDVKASCRALAASNITLSGTQTIDDVVLVAGDRVLVNGQTTGSENGIYVVAASAWARASDADTAAKLNANAFTFIEEGTTYADSGWVLTANNPITLGTTALSFTQFSGAGQITAGNGLTKSGNTLSVLAANSTISSTVSGISVGTGSITNTQISASAAIADTKLATISTAGKVSDSALSSNVALLTGTQTFSGSKTFGNLTTTSSLTASTNNAGVGEALTISNTGTGTGVLTTFKFRDSAASTVTGAEISAIKVGAYTSGTISTYTSALVFETAHQSTSTTEAARITNNKALLINTTTDNGTDKLQVAGSADFTGKVKTPASTTTSAGLLVPHGAAPTTPADGDVWTTTSGLFAQINGSTVQFGSGSGSVTSVALSLPAIFTVSGSPVTGAGTLSATLASQTANTVFAAPNGSAGAPTFRTIVAADLPTATAAALGVARAGTGLAVSSGIFSVDSAAVLRTIRVVTAAGAVTCAATDDVVVINKTTGAATAVTLPSSPSTGKQVIIKDGKGDAATNNITVSPAAGTIDGVATHVIDGDYGARTFVYNGTQWNLI